MTKPRRRATIAAAEADAAAEHGQAQLGWRRHQMFCRPITVALAAAAMVALAASAAAAQDVVKIGMSFAMTGAGFNAAGRQAAAGARLYVQQHGNMVAGKKIETILRDDAGVADNARRLV